MTAPAPFTTGTRSGHAQATAGRAQTRLPWWGVVLPAVGFAVLLLLLVGGEADATERSGEGPLMAFLALLHHTLFG